MKKNTRGASYPVMDLEAATKKIKQILDAVGKAPNDKQVIMQAMGYSGDSGASRRAFAAMIQYGLLAKSGSNYQISSTALRFLFPQTESEQDEVLATLAKEPTLFQTLVERFAGEKLPSMLPNTLVSQFGINPSSGKEAAEVFERTMRYAGMLDNDGVLNDYISLESITSSGADQSVPAHSSATKTMAQTAQPISLLAQNSLKKLPSGIELAFPQVFDFAVLTGEFGEEIRALELKAQALLARQGKEDNEGAKQQSA